MCGVCHSPTADGGVCVVFAVHVPVLPAGLPPAGGPGRLAVRQRVHVRQRPHPAATRRQGQGQNQAPQDGGHASPLAAGPHAA